MLETYHQAVLVQEALTYLAPQPGGVYLDVTFGGGGHSRAILEYEPRCQVIGMDWDQKALELNAPPLERDFPNRFKPIWANFAQAGLALKRAKLGKVDGILADFGTSQYQLSKQPGFSFMHDTPLDMRMSPAHQRITAYDLVNKGTTDQLIQIFRDYGEEHRAHKIARAIVELRRKRPIKTTGDLVNALGTVIPMQGYYKIHPATKVFQALRIAVNQELDNIHSLLLAAPALLNPQGRIVCISFHSLEDRMVKHYFRDHKSIFTLLTPKVVRPAAEELEANPSARSARLRAALFQPL